MYTDTLPEFHWKICSFLVGLCSRGNFTVKNEGLKKNK